MNPAQFNYSTSSSSSSSASSRPVFPSSLTTGTSTMTPSAALLRQVGRQHVLGGGISLWDRVLRLQSAPPGIIADQLNLDLCPSPAAFHPLTQASPHTSPAPLESASDPPVNTTGSLKWRSSGTHSEDGFDKPTQRSTQTGDLQQSTSSRVQHRDPKRLKRTSSQKAESHASSTPSELNYLNAMFMQRVADAIRKNNLSQTGMQLRRGEVRKSLDEIPDVIKNLICGYIYAEPCLRPFTLGPFGEVIDILENTYISEAIFFAFSHTDMDSMLFRKAILHTHRRCVLDQVFGNLLGVRNARILNENIQARQRRKEELTAIVNYLPVSKCKKAIQQKLKQLEKLRKDCAESGRKDLHDNVDGLDTDLSLLINCAKESDSASEKLREIFELPRYELYQLKLKIDSDAEKRRFISAQSSIIKAFELLCDKGNKRGAVGMAVRFIALSIDMLRVSKDNNLREIIQLVELIRPLCLTYPSDIDLYAELLFKINDFAVEKSQLSVAQKLCLHTSTSFMRELPVYSKAKVIHRTTSLAYAVTPHEFKTFKLVARSIRHFHQAHEYHEDGPTFGFNQPKLLFTEPKREVSKSEFLRCFADLYHIAAKIIHHLSLVFLRLPPGQRAMVCELLMVVGENMDGELASEFDHMPLLSLRHSGADFSSDLSDQLIQEQFVVAEADCYKKGLKILLDDNCNDQQEEQNQPTVTEIDNNLSPENASFFVKIMGELVDLYYFNGLRNELDMLTRTEIQSAIAVELPNITEKLHNWRGLLRYMDPPQDEA